MNNSNTRKSLGSMVVRSLIRASAVAGALANTVACSASAQEGGGADAGAGGSDSGAGSDGGGGSKSPWTVVPLIDQVDPADPTNIVRRKDQDDVTGIYFESPEKGFIVTQGNLRSLGAGGAVFKATGTAVTAIAFSDADDSNPTNYHGLERTPGGYVAMGAAD